jgi:serine/threonine protein kinase
MWSVWHGKALQLDIGRSKVFREIQHDHIVPLFEAFQDTDTFLVYEMMHMSLDVLIGCGEKFNEPQIARICHEVSDLLDNCSLKLMIKLLLAIVNLTSKGLQHGNITPSSVLFTSSGVTKLGTCCADSLSRKLII